MDECVYIIILFNSDVSQLTVTFPPLPQREAVGRWSLRRRRRRRRRLLASRSVVVYVRTYESTMRVVGAGTHFEPLVAAPDM